MPAWKGPLDVQGGGWVRKEQCNYGWDWGPVLVTCGIWRPIKLIAYDTARIEDVYITQKHQKGRVTLNIDIGTDIFGKHSGGDITVKVSRCGQPGQSTSVVAGKHTRVSLVIDRPELWWPNGMGSQPLYDVTVNLADKAGGFLDSVTKRIGLRTLRLQRKKDRWGESFAFNVNGVTFFAKGADWIPADTFVPSITPENYRDLIESAAECNMNMLRVWGGGIYEQDMFYDLCDEMGICVWQDFMFACSAYPVFDQPWLENFLAEAGDNIKRLRHHSCIA
jgi:beta-mannosidase